MKRRIFAGVLAVVLLVGMVLAVLPTAFADTDTVELWSAEDFVAFAKNCTLDTWSENKTVYLMCDIDFSDTEFLPVPTFGGTFYGNGFTLSGIRVGGKGSYRGVFRYLRQDGKISGLCVRGSVMPEGSKSFVGGVVGENSGVVESCSFEGLVKGENVVGGVVGNNTDFGKIISCTAAGTVSGENSTGGIAGKNSGLMQDSKNYASVNTVYEEKKNTLSDMDTDAGAMIESYKNAEEENEEESVLGHTDTGGVVGYTSGIAEGCVNYASVGYQHIGYNVGGVAGRQSGYLLGCQNYGTVQGRKDVGGIVGQAEPYILLDADGNTLRNVKQELSNLNGMVNRLMTDAEQLGDHTETYLKEISEHTKTARESTEVLLERGTDFVDGNIDELNAQAAILSDTLERMEPVLQNLENGSADLADAMEEIASAVDSLGLDGAVRDELDSALSYMSRVEKDLRKAVARANSAKSDWKNAVKTDDADAAKQALRDLGTAVGEIATAKQNIRDSLEQIITLLQQKPESWEDLGTNGKEILEDLQTVQENLKTEIRALESISQSVDALVLHTSVDFSLVRSAAANMEDSLSYLNDAIYGIAKALQDLTDAAELLLDGDDGSNGLADGIRDLAYAADDLKKAFGEMKEIVSDLADNDAINFVKTGDEFRDAGESLFDSLSGISDEIDGMRNNLSGDKDTVGDEVRAVVNQFHLVMDLLIGEAENLSNGDRSLSDLFLDVSDEELETAKQGKLDRCHNYGTVEADRNTGGIAGAMAIEYAKDPEDESEKPTTLNFTYRSRAVVQSCVNDGAVCGKKDCTGGIVGKAELGTVYRCENYGSTASSDGNYVGGIVGKSGSAVRKSYAKGRVSGKRYVGGIAGKAEVLASNYAIVSAEGEENIGAVCGDADSKDALTENRFVDHDLGAVDGISYEGKGFPIAYEELAALSGVPVRFISFTVTFLADGKVVATRDIAYGEETARIVYPEIPQKEGHYGKWQKVEAETVTEDIEVLCEYAPYITLLSSAEKNDSGKLALALAEGEFTDEAELHIADSSELPPEHTDGSVRVYDISLANTELAADDTVTLRILNENKDNITAWVLQDGRWEKVKALKRGKYAVLETKGTESTVCLRYESKNRAVLWVTLGLTAVGIGAVLLLRKRRKKNA